MERLVFKKIEIWIVLLLAILSLIATVFFGWVVQHAARGGTQAGAIGDFALDIAQFPSLVKRVLITRDFNLHKAPERFDLPPGFTYHSLRNPARTANYILINRYDGDAGFNVSELWRERGAGPIVKWRFHDPEKFQYEIKNHIHQNAVTSDPSSMRATHSHIDLQGRLTFHFGGSALYQVDSNSNLVWKNDEFAYHHSVEADMEGNFWVPGTSLQPPNIEGFDEYYRDDFLVQVDSKGKTLFSKSVTTILLENGLINRMYVYDRYQRDPIHLNDIQPVL